MTQISRLARHLFGLAILLLPRALPGQALSRSIAITIDDLPAASASSMTAKEIASLNGKLLTTLQAEKVPAIGFVNEEKLYKTGEVDARIAVLNAWLDAGCDLGNHTFSHTSLPDVELKDWEDDVILGETVTRLLLKAHNKDLRFFRHPYLAVGQDLATRRAAEAFLTGRGYRIAPVTIDALDWYFADLYDEAHRRTDTAEQQKITRAWLDFTASVLVHDEHLSRDLLGYEPKQILLLHATWLEADHLPDLLALLRHRGYAFLSLADALTDPAYAQPDEYISDVGVGWLDHWAVTRGRPDPPAGKPQIPAWVQERHAALDQKTIE